MTEIRAQIAQRLVDEGRVKVWGKTEYGVRAYVTDGVSKHLVVLYPYGHYFCECRAGHYHFDTTALCLHALAVKLAVEGADSQNGPTSGRVSDSRRQSCPPRP